MIGPSISAPGASSNSQVAQSHAETFLAAHISLLSPGADAADFRLTSNVVSRNVRAIGFNQYHEGKRVLGGQISFRYKNDRLLMIASEALPNVQVRSIGPAIDQRFARASAKSWPGQSLVPTDDAEPVNGPYILPIIFPNGSIEYREVFQTRAKASLGVGEWLVYVDINSGAPYARRQMLAFGTGTVSYEVNKRRPNSERVEVLVPNTDVFVNGTKLRTDEFGTLTFDGDTTVDVETRPAGLFAQVSNVAGRVASDILTLADEASVVWDPGTSELEDAQVNAYVHSLLAKDFARKIAPDLEWLDEKLPVNVNIDEHCNAFFDGDSINFFQAGEGCANTARLTDVVYHEFGHGLHTNSIIEGVGRFDGAHSEGLSDFLAASITGDPAMGRGFFNSAAPLRHIDPPDREHVYPDDIGGIHFTGLIFAGAMWDLRKLLIQKYGEVAGVEKTLRLYYSTLERATDIPSTYYEVIVEDDDNGDLSDGTPNICDINTAFGLHGIRDFTIAVPPLGNEELNDDGQEITISLGGDKPFLFSQCPGDSIATMVLRWRRNTDTTTELDMERQEGGEFSATIPPGENGDVTRYQVVVTLADGATKTFPDNIADPAYQFFTGDTVQLYCTSFDSDPFEEGWTHGETSGEQVQQNDDWQWGSPASAESAGDPSEAFTGENILGNDLGGGEFNGLYQPSKTNFAQLPDIDVGNYSDVHLQYYRWLSVEDAFFDKASIFANDELAWQNLNSDQDVNSNIHHVDKEWRFQDVAISEVTRDSMVKIKFELASDQGLEFGGWNIDDVCVVAVANSICGDGNVTGAETCDDGDENADTADACRLNCVAPICGDAIVDSGEQCDDGNLLSGDGCSSICEKQGGCNSGGGTDNLPGFILLLLAVAASRIRRAKSL